MPYTDKSARYQSSYDEDSVSPFSVWSVVALSSMVALFLYADANYNHGHATEALLALIGF